jgi:DNA-binding beta-propeller fold protein YncE
MRGAKLGLMIFASALAGTAHADERSWLPTGQTVTPLAAPGSTFQPLNVDLPVVGKVIAGGGVTTAVSPDGRTLFLLTSGFNFWRDANGKEVKDASVEHLFTYDLTSTSPERKQDQPIPEAYGGLALSSDGKSAYVATGSDDAVRFYRVDSKGHWSEDGDAVVFGHKAGNGLIKSPLVLKPMAAGIALSADGKILVVANYENDSIDVVNVEARKIAAELDLRPGKLNPERRGVAGGEFPYWIAIKGNDTAYVSSERDREIDVIALNPQPQVTERIAIQGNPNRLLLDHAQDKLFVAADNTDRVFIIDTSTNKIASSSAVGMPTGFGPNAHLPGAAPNSLALSPDEKTLYLTEGGINAVGVVDVSSASPVLLGLIPTAWQPNSVSVSADGKNLYVANGKSPAGPDPHNCAKAQATTANCSATDQLGAANQYVWQHTTGGLQTIPVPDPVTLKRLTAEVADNNGYTQVMSKADMDLMATLRKRIKHVIYIVKENRTYDQILGDIKGADGDPALVQFGQAVTTNEHALAKQFVTLDAFFDSGEASGNGWQWSTAARTTDVTEKEMPVNYADRGLTYDFEGHSRGINVAIPIEQRRKANPVNDPDPDLLPGPANQAAPDGPDGETEQGYVWDAALRAQKTVRSYGFFVDIVRYDTHVPEAARIPLERDPYAKRLTVSISSNARLMNLTDPYFRGFDNKMPDLYRYREWNREFTGYEKKGHLPNFEMVRFMHDHTGDFKDAIDGVNTPDTQIADNDYAVGLLVDRVAHSKFAGSTLVFVIEDDAQDGPDHVDAHRSVAFVAGPYVKQHSVVSDRYTTVNIIRTIEEVLGLKPLNFHDANARPMTTVFDLRQASWSYRAKVPAMLRSTQLPLPAATRADATPIYPLHDAAWWTAATQGFDFSSEDRLKPAPYNAVLWKGTMGGKAYPKSRDGRNRRVAAR